MIYYVKLSFKKVVIRDIWVEWCDNYIFMYNEYLNKLSRKYCIFCDFIKMKFLGYESG